MNLFTGIILYLIIFWTSLFVILPWGAQAPENPELGMASSAPENPRIKEKFLVTAVVAALLWGVIAFLIHIEVFDFRSIARDMVQEDYAS